MEVLGGLALALISHDTVVGIATALTRAELMEDPRDLVANAMRQAAEGFTTDAQSFAAWYLFSHGLIKLALVAAVLANRVWAYPAFIAAMIGFILYQVYRMSFEVSFVLVAITVLDSSSWHSPGTNMATCAANAVAAGHAPMSVPPNGARGADRL